MSGWAAPVPTPATVTVAGAAFCRIHVKAAGLFASDRTDLEHAREIFLNFVAELIAAAEPGGLPLVPFPAGSGRVDLMVRADQVTAIEVVRVDKLRGVR